MPFIENHSRFRCVRYDETNKVFSPQEHYEEYREGDNLTSSDGSRSVHDQACITEDPKECNHLQYYEPVTNIGCTLGKRSTGEFGDFNFIDLNLCYVGDECQEVTHWEG